MIVIEEGTRLVQRHDVAHRTQTFKLLEALRSDLGPDFMPKLKGPSDDDLLFAHEECFSISLNADYHKPDSAVYTGIHVSGKTVSDVYEKFINDLKEKTEEGFCISLKTDNESNYLLEWDIVKCEFKKYKKITEPV